MDGDGGGASLERLQQLYERARAPEGGTEDFDALIAELSRPLVPGEATPERAELLHTLAEDRFLGGFRGTRGERVDEAVIHALVAVGESPASLWAPAPRPPPPPPQEASSEAPSGPEGAEDWPLARRLALYWGVFVVGCLAWIAALKEPALGGLTGAVGVGVLVVVHTELIALLDATSRPGGLGFFLHLCGNLVLVAGLGVIYFVAGLLAEDYRGTRDLVPFLAVVLLLDVGGRALVLPVVLLRKLFS